MTDHQQRRIDPDDTATWLPLDGLAPGFDTNKPPRSTALAGRDLTVAFADGTRVRHVFADERQLAWEFIDGSGGAGTTDSYEAFEVAAELYYVQFRHLDRPVAVSLVLDLAAGRALGVITTIGPVTPDRPACEQRFLPGTFDGLRPSGPPPAPSSELIGRRALWVYSSQHAYEHIYLSGQRYTWQCLGGPERGLSDTDACTTYLIRPGIYVFGWRERVVPCAAVTVADHIVMRSYGMLFGLDESARDTTYFTFGAYGRLLGVTVYPDGYEPPTAEGAR